MGKWKRSFTLFVVFALVFLLQTSSYAETLESEREYKPLDLVVVIDTSGSMKHSDPNKTALDSVRMLVNMMPAMDSRVGIIGFNTDPTLLTSSGLVSLESFSGLETVREAVKRESVPYTGDTGIGNALIAATQLLDKESDESHDRAIILFTDGVDDFEGTPTEQLRQARLSACEENEANAIQWAKQNNCYIYCAGYDYTMSNGTSSMGNNGEGLVKLQNIASNTSGKFSVIHSIDEMEQLLIDFLADVCDLYYKSLATIPGDGGVHEVVIPVDMSVVEANVRIVGGNMSEIQGGKVRLYDPTGAEVPLKNENNIRFDVDVSAASIKVVMPQTGDWRLVIDGIEGDDIHVGLLEHYKMNLTSMLTFPENNPSGVAYTNDEIGIKTWLTYDGKDLTDQDIYDAVTGAKATVVSRINPDNIIEIPLVRENNSFQGSFVIPEDSVYDITIRLDWNTVYREDTITVHSSNKPLQLVGKMENVRVKKNKTAVLKDIYRFVSDDENDAITATISGQTNEDKATVSLQGDEIQMEGKKAGTSVISVTFKDAQGNTVESSYKLRVIDPVIYISLGIMAVLLLVLLALLVYAVKHMTDRIKGKAKVVVIARGVLDDNNQYFNVNTLYENPARNNKMTSFDSVNNIPGEKSSYNPGGNSDPLGNQSNPFGGKSDPFGSQSNPFGGKSDPFGSQSNPFGGKSDPFGSQSNPFGGKSDPFGSQSNPFGSKSDPFGGQSDSFSEQSDLFSGNQKGFHQGESPSWMKERKENETDKTVNDDKVFSDEFDESFFIGGARVKKQTLDVVLHEFLKLYCQFMDLKLRGGADGSMLVRDVKQFVDTELSPSLKKVLLLGTTGGLSGMKIKVDKKCANRTIIFHSPSMKKNKASMNPGNGSERLSISIVNGVKEDKYRPCMHFEMDYSKR